MTGEKIFIIHSLLLIGDHWALDHHFLLASVILQCLVKQTYSKTGDEYIDKNPTNLRKLLQKNLVGHAHIHVKSEKGQDCWQYFQITICADEKNMRKKNWAIIVSYFMV